MSATPKLTDIYCWDFRDRSRIRRWNVESSKPVRGGSEFWACNPTTSKSSFFLLYNIQVSSFSKKFKFQALKFTNHTNIEIWFQISSLKLCMRFVHGQHNSVICKHFHCNFRESIDFCTQVHNFFVIKHFMEPVERDR